MSEGIAYGMLIAVYMGTKDDQMLFDDLWRYSQAHLNGQRPDELVDRRERDDGHRQWAAPPTPTRTSRSRC